MREEDKRESRMEKKGRVEKAKKKREGRQKGK
jgi:hypothetical protein